MKSPSRQAGFTIVELMIATAVLSVILLMTTVVITGIGRLYYKGINQSRVQNTVRSVSDDISQKLQLASEDVQYFWPGKDTARIDANLGAYCIESTRYSFVLGVQIGQQKEGTSTTYQHVLWRDVMPLGTPCEPLDLAGTDSPGGDEGQELISPNSRLTEFSVTGPTGGGIESPYTITTGVAYGDNDLLTGEPSFTGPDVKCKSDIGGQFCAASRLSTIAVKRTASN